MSEHITKLDVEKFDGKLHLDKCIKEEDEDTAAVTAADDKGKDKAKDIEGYVKKEPISVEKDAEKELRAKNLISLCLSNSILRKVMKEPTALAIWKALERDYQKKALPNRIYLKQKFASYRMDATRSIEDNYNDFLKMVDDLAALNVNINDEDQAIQLLSSLPRQYEPLVHSFKYGGGKDSLTVNDVISSAYSKEIDLKEQGLGSRSDGEGLYVESKGKQQWREKSKGKSKFTKGCFICGKEDHWKKDCPERKYYKPKGSANVASEPPQPLVLTVSEHNTKGEWIMDSGCVFHVTPDKEVLFDLEEFNGGKLLMANNTESEVKGIGKVKIQNRDGSEVILTGVRYMPGVSRNLISYGKLEDAGCHYVGGNFMVQFYKDGKKALSAKYKDGLYYLQGTVAKVKGNTAESSEEIESKEVKEDSKNSEEVESKEDGVVAYALGVVKQEQKGRKKGTNTRDLAAKEDVVLPKNHPSKNPAVVTGGLPDLKSRCCSVHRD